MHVGPNNLPEPAPPIQTMTVQTMTQDTQRNRFQDFFEEDRYVILKNHLYNYLIRKKTIRRALELDEPRLILEIGSGLSPVVANRNRVIYSELSWLALKTLKESHKEAWYVVADGTRLPFKGSSVSHVVISEVLEHIDDDELVLQETGRVLSDQGRLLLTFPHRKSYFGNDDRYVQHCRRYELDEMTDRLKRAGMIPIKVEKVLGPLEKITMSTVVACIKLYEKLHRPTPPNSKSTALIRFVAPPFKWLNFLYAGLVRMDAWLMPRALSAVLLIKAEKRTR